MMFNRGSGSTSRLSSQLSQSITLVRGKKTNIGSHYPKEPSALSYSPRIPKIRNPYDIRTPAPSSSASTPQPYEFQPYTPKTTSVPLDGSALRLHHAPPASAPSFTNGTVPVLLQWLGGTSVSLTGEESAPLRAKSPARSPAYDHGERVDMREWSDELRSRIVSLRAEGKSRLQIAKELRIPPMQLRSIARIAPQSEEARHQKELVAKERMLSMPYRRQVKLAVSKRRKDFW